MIISASYKTDIPTFYGAWFMNRVAAGYCKVVNPYGRQVYRVDLAPAAVDGFVFWTKNIGPFLPDLDALAAQGYAFVVQYSITGYPRALESAVVDAQEAVRHMRVLRARFGPRAAVWRYDTVILSSLTPLDFHRRNFAGLAQALEGVTDEVVISFAQIYKKTQRNLDRAAAEHGFQWHDPPDPLKADLAQELAGVARRRGMQLSLCAQPAYLGPGVDAARCIDAQRLADVAGRAIPAAIQGNRPGCACFAARDIGEYDTCPHGCAYCYAVQNRNAALKRFRQHDPAGEFLFDPLPQSRTARGIAHATQGNTVQP